MWNRLVKLPIGILACLATVSCGGPDRPGPNVEDVPAGFVFDANASSARKVFADLQEVDQSGWIAMDANDDHSSIMITTYAGTVPEDQIRSARNTHAERWGRKRGAQSGSDYGAVEEIEIEGHKAWAWEITQHYRGGISSMEWVAVVPYEDQTYAIEFHAGMDPHKDWDLIRNTVLSFRQD